MANPLDSSVGHFDIESDLLAVLRPPAERMRRAVIRRVVAASVCTGATAAIVVCGIVAVMIALSRRQWVGPQAAVWAGGLGGGMIAAWAVAAVLRAAWRPCDLADVAERLDLAAGDHNAIATALELARRADPSPFRRRAILDGLAAGRRLAAWEPAAEPRTLPYGRIAGVAVGGLAVFWPRSCRGRAKSRRRGWRPGKARPIWHRPLYPPAAWRRFRSPLE